MVVSSNGKREGLTHDVEAQDGPDSVDLAGSYLCQEPQLRPAFAISVLSFQTAAAS